MKYVKFILMMAIFVIVVSLGFVFHDRILPIGVKTAHGVIPENADKAWLSEVTGILGCHCGCDMTLKECEQDDPDCQLRPAIIEKLPSTREPDGLSMVELGGCSCGCGYKLTECEVKHKSCNQRPRIHQQLKRIAIKYGYEKNFAKNSGIDMSDAERRMFQQALKGHISLIYVHKEKKSGKSKYMKPLTRFQKKYRDRLSLIPISLAAKEEKDLLKYYKITDPSVVMVAPNGAVTAFFKGEPSVEKMKLGLVSPKMEEVLLAIQQGMTIFLCVGNPDRSDFKRAKETTQSAVRKLGGIASAIWLDPNDSSEKSLLSALKYNGNPKGASVIVIAPTGLLIERIDEGFTERRLFDSFQKILAMKSGCGQSTITGGSACQPGYGVAGESSCQ